MLDRIIYFSIHHKLIIGLFTIALIAWGGYSATQLPIDAVPDITNNQVQVITYAPSQSAQDIERLVTFPVEQTMATIPDIEEIRSFSRFGLSVVTIVFQEGVDVYWARQQVNERLSEVRSLIPAGIDPPELAPVTTGLGEIYQYVLHPKPGYEKKYDAMQLRTIQDWIVRRQLLGTAGVADVSSFGGFLKQYEIAVDPDKLRSFNLSISDLFTALEKNNQNTGGAYIDKKPHAYFIRSEGLIGSPADLGSVMVKMSSGGIPVLIRNVADVRYGNAIRYGAMTRNDAGEVVGGIVLMLKGANSSQVIASVKQRVAQIAQNLPEGVTIEPFLDRTKLVNKAIGTVTKNLAEGALIVIFVLVLLLGNLRAGLIVASVIPLSMLFAIALMNVFGVSGNLMSLGAIDFGLIVDGSVIIVEATMHYLGVRAIGKPLTQTEMDQEVYQSASKIRNSAAFGEIIILIVYLPILVLVGVEGKMFRPMAQTVSFAILGAFILSLTYVPMMSARFLSKKTTAQLTISDRIMAFFHRLYAPLIQWALRRKWLVVGVSAALFLASLVAFSRLGAEFIPTLDEGDFAVETRVLTGSSLSETIDAAQKSARVLLNNFPEIKEVIGKVGSSEIPTDPMPIEACDLMIILKDRDEWTSADSREELAEKMQQTLEAHIPGVTYGFQQPIQMRFNELMTGARQDVVIKVYGEDLNQLSTYARQIARIVPTVRGVRDLYVEEVTGLPQIVVGFKRDQIAKFGLNIEDVNQAINTAFAGQRTGFVYEGERRFDLVVRLRQQSRQNIEDVRNLYIATPLGGQVPLQQLADVQMVTGPNQIQRDDTKRRITVAFNVRGRDVESVVEEIQQQINRQIRFSPGYYPSYGGTFENLREARSRLSVAVPVALALIFMLLYFTFGSIKQSLLIFTAIPLSAIGGILALWLRGMPFSISAGVGFIALFGVAVLNGIVLIAEFNRLRKEGLTDLGEIVRQGTRTRLRPVILTAAVASLGFLPMALSGSEGAEVQRPLATVVIGGLITATLLTLVVLPVLYTLFERKIRINPAAVIIAALTMALLFPAQAQTPDGAFTLEEAVRTASQNNPSVAAARREIEVSRQLKRTASDLGKTTLSGQFGQYNGYAKEDNNFSVSQTFPFPTTFGARGALAKANLQSNEWQLATTENEFTYQVKSAFYQLAYLETRQRWLTGQDSLYRGFARAADVRQRTGEGTLLEKTTAESQARLVRTQSAQNEADIRIYQTRLQTLLNQPQPVQIRYDSLTARLVTEADSAALSGNPQLAQAQQQIEVARKRKSVERNSFLPDITVGYFNQTLIGTSLGADNVVGLADRNDRFQGVQVGLSLPLWFVPQAARIRAAEAETEVAEARYVAQQNSLNGQYQELAQEHGKYRESLNYYWDISLPQAELILRQAQQAYQSGEIGYVEYLQSLQTATTIRTDYLHTLNQYNQAVIRLEFILGNQ